MLIRMKTRTASTLWTMLEWTGIALWWLYLGIVVSSTMFLVLSTFYQRK